MRYTVMLPPETDPDVQIAYAPVLGVVTQGRTAVDASIAAQEAATLAVWRMVADGEEVPDEPADAFFEQIDVAVPVPG